MRWLGNLLNDLFYLLGVAIGSAMQAIQTIITREKNNDN